MGVSNFGDATRLTTRHVGNRSQLPAAYSVGTEEQALCCYAVTNRSIATRPSTKLAALPSRLDSEKGVPETAKDQG